VFIKEQVKKMDYVNEVKKLRMDMGMNRKEFCDYYGIPYRTVADWEAGKRKMPEYVLRLMEFRAETERKKKKECGESIRRASILSKRDKEVLNMQLVLIPIMAEAWKKTYCELSDIFKEYDVLNYIDVCYESYNSTGNQGIINDLKDYIEMQGGCVV
jgi:transcriptional regulator with XRE-family HTH domain